MDDDTGFKVFVGILLTCIFLFLISLFSCAASEKGYHNGICHQQCVNLGMETGDRSSGVCVCERKLDSIIGEQE